jgi:thioesterase domain-containing protein
MDPRGPTLLAGHSYGGAVSRSHVVAWAMLDAHPPAAVDAMPDSG